MSPGIDSQVASGLLVELAREERAVRDKYREFVAARTAYDVASRRYQAVRDAAANYIGKFPFSTGVAWPASAEKLYAVPPVVKKGNFRFLGMPVGDAVAILLQEADGEPMSTDEVLIALRHGMLSTNARALHAAAINTPGVVKKGDSYAYEPEGPKDDRGDIDPDDLPF